MTLSAWIRRAVNAAIRAEPRLKRRRPTPRSRITRRHRCIPMQIWFSVCVRRADAASPPETPKREGAAALGCSARRGRSGSHACRTARLHAHASSRSAWDQPLDLRPSRPAADRDDRNAVGYTVDSRRRAPAAACRAPPGSSTASNVSGTARACSSGPDRCLRANSSRTRRRLEPRRDRAQPQRRPGAHSARRRAVVALNRACSPSPISGMRHDGANEFACQNQPTPSHRDDDSEFANVTRARMGRASFRRRFRQLWF